MITLGRIIRWRQPPGSSLPLSTSLRQVPLPPATGTRGRAGEGGRGAVRRPRKIFQSAGLPKGSSSHRGRFSPGRKPFQGQVKTRGNTMRKQPRCIPHPSGRSIPHPRLPPPPAIPCNLLTRGDELTRRSRIVRDTWMNELARKGRCSWETLQTTGLACASGSRRLGYRRRWHRGAKFPFCRVGVLHAVLGFQGNCFRF